MKKRISNPTALKIFLFIGLLHASNINEILMKCGYGKIYETISTSVEILNPLSVRGVNLIFSDVPELIPVSVELLSKLSELELTRELFEIKLIRVEKIRLKRTFHGSENK